MSATDFFTPEQLAAIERKRALTPEQLMREHVLHKLAEIAEDADRFEVRYQAYIVSDEWRRRAEAAKARAGYRCQVCNRQGRLNAHHRTYARLGNEEDGDLVVLCEGCHQLFHENGRLQR